MATITPYVAKGTRAGQNVNVKAKKVVWIKVGQGSVAKMSDYEVAIAGKISILGYNGDLNIHLNLLDEQPGATSGPARLKLNSHLDENATYKSNGKDLTVFAVLGGKKQNITILPANNGTQTECKLFGHVDQTVHLEPA